MSLEEGPEAVELRSVTDVRTLRALTHPVRIALLEALSLGGAMTATEVGDRIGESPTTCSFHLRQLAKYGFVEEAGGGKGRARPWRMTAIGMSIGSTPGDAASEVAANALTRLVRERQLDRHRQWLETRRTYPERWQDAAQNNEFVLYLTAAELAELNQEISAMLLSRFRERLDDPAQRPGASLPVEMLVFSYPISVPAGDDGENER
ncbi:hypothetical protein ALI144C_04320 [Actinosynnema sp. ALI-1.44]|uniref:helix-turn-helix domain-containing protein n=1 Tax=Actinosynnema sp. ALI-1.44 TaxID=1933779 RepID=UPI00097C2ED0|nr:helix-turn-helix domain-containing protein [Actinosynnema sp. ALI-1.44]ONI89578.1 hypothetical protein ALI144C_04320 [Actinosynnema sp. ALI-1.44]